MVFSTPDWVSPIPWPVPDSLPLGEFTLNGADGVPRDDSKPVVIDGVSGKQYSREDLRQRVEWLAAGLVERLGWAPNQGSPWDKVVAIYSLNTIDLFALSWAIHRLNGICLMIHPTSSVGEIVSHMQAAKCETLFTCQTLVATAVGVAGKLSIAQRRIFTLPLPDGFLKNPESIDGFTGLEELVNLGLQAPPLEPLAWKEGQAKEQIAYLCATSGTSGKQKLAMISHFAIIHNIMQVSTYEKTHKESWRPQCTSGVIPFTHGYGIEIGHLGAWRGEQLVVLPRFDMQLMLQSVQDHRIERLYLVPPIIVALANNAFLFDLFDLSSVRTVVNGASGLDQSLIDKVHAVQPDWTILTAYGLTESVFVSTFTSAHNTWPGSSGSLLPLTEAKLVDSNGREVQGLNASGEILIRAPNVFKGYLGNEQATRDSFDQDGWLRTGDIGMFKKSPGGPEHLFILDRIKEMIKVKGLQVVPVDIELVLREHPAIADVAVIGVPDENAGERAKAFVVRSKTVQVEVGDEDLAEELDDFVQDRLDESHWLHDRVVFVDALPKSQSGKVLKRELRTLPA
ncbi:hypothetical protein B0T14DRAFT_507874 [Immersiella caudata]|uniref:Acetyl-CoA synthetase-like protein n=1 Tax=Immersiella caudata TaxID=314043 RepID=A0AA40CDU6_9PEZI|nr:hypothetical protein B0T14DRAFT_507874 [Immersiella caudata]